MAKEFFKKKFVSEAEPELAFDQMILPPEYLAEVEAEEEDQPAGDIPMEPEVAATPIEAAPATPVPTLESLVEFRAKRPEEPWQAPLTEALHDADMYVKACPAGDPMELLRRQLQFDAVQRVVNTRLYLGS